MDWNVEPILSFLLKLPELLGSLHYFAQQQSFLFSLGNNFVTGQHAFTRPGSLCLLLRVCGGGGALSCFSAGGGNYLLINRIILATT